MDTHRHDRDPLQNHVPSIEYGRTGKASMPKMKSTRSRSLQGLSRQGRSPPKDIIRKSYYPDWLSNPVLVLKPNGK